MRTTPRSSEGFAIRARWGGDASRPVQASPTAERGSAVLVVLALLSIMLVFVAANTYTTRWLRREVKLVEKRQVDRLQHAAANRPPAGATTPGARPVP